MRLRAESLASLRASVALRRKYEEVVLRDDSGIRQVITLDDTALSLGQEFE
jgi:hypothetical protein